MKGGAVLAAEKIKGGDEGAQIQRASKIEGFYCGFLGRPSGHAQIDSSTHQLHGIFEAASFGGTNIDPTAWEDKKNAGESRFPAQVRVVMRKICEPLEEDSFRPILHHYDGPKFRLELNIPEALSLLDIFAENNASSSSCDVIN